MGTRSGGGSSGGVHDDHDEPIEPRGDARWPAIGSTVRAPADRTFVVMDAMPPGLEAFAGPLAELALGVIEDPHLLAGETLTPPPPGCTPALRAHRRLMARVFVDLLARHRDWSA